MFIATVTACKGHTELGMTIYRDRPIVSVEIELVKIQLEQLLSAPASFVVQYAREDDHTLGSPITDYR